MSKVSKVSCIPFPVPWERDTVTDGKRSQQTRDVKGSRPASLVVDTG